MADNADHTQDLGSAPDPTTPPEGEGDDGMTEDDGLDPKAAAALRKVRNEARNLRQRLKDLEPLAAKAKELEDAGKSDVEKLTAELGTRTTEAEQAKAELARLKVAMRKGLTEAQARRLVGSTEEELEADADELLATFGPATKAPGDRPKERFTKPAGGVDPEEPDEPVDYAAVAQSIRNRRY